MAVGATGNVPNSLVRANNGYGWYDPVYTTRGTDMQVRNHFGLQGTYSPEEAASALAIAQKNPIPGRPFEGTMSKGPWAGLINVVYDQIPQAAVVMGDVDIPEQQNRPENPGIRKATVSTYGAKIPISLGRRRLYGNIIESSALVPRLVGTRTYTVEVEVPYHVVPPECVDETGPGGDPCEQEPDPCNPTQTECGYEDAPEAGANGSGGPSPEPPDPEPGNCDDVVSTITLISESQNTYRAADNLEIEEYTDRNPSGCSVGQEYRFGSVRVYECPSDDAYLLLISINTRGLGQEGTFEPCETIFQSYITGTYEAGNYRVIGGSADYEAEALSYLSEVMSVA